MLVYTVQWQKVGYIVYASNKVEYLYIIIIIVCSCIAWQAGGLPTRLLRSRQAAAVLGCWKL